MYMYIPVKYKNRNSVFSFKCQISRLFQLFTDFGKATHSMPMHLQLCVLLSLLNQGYWKIHEKYQGFKDSNKFICNNRYILLRYLHIRHDVIVLYNICLVFRNYKTNY